MSELDALLEELDSLHARIEATGRDALGKAFDQLFREYPEIKAITWTQYTPYFNDGDPCVFHPNDIYVGFQGKDLTQERIHNSDNDEAGVYDELADDVDVDEDDCIYFYYPSTGRYAAKYGYTWTERQLEALMASQRIETTLNKLVGILEVIYGDHARVTITPEGANVEEYVDHS